MFVGDFDFADRTKRRASRAFAAGSEVFSNRMNSGVMLINVPIMIAEWPRMLAYAVCFSVGMHAVNDQQSDAAQR